MRVAHLIRILSEIMLIIFLGKVQHNFQFLAEV